LGTMMDSFYKRFLVAAFFFMVVVCVFQDLAVRALVTEMRAEVAALAACRNR
jgi:hypothetical protein